MRVSALAAAGLLAGCTSTFDEPRFTVSPYYAVYQLRGDTTLQTDYGGTVPIADNPPRQLSDFGQEHHEDDVGLRAEVGDGFGGLRVDYYRLDMPTMQNGILPGAWGALWPGDEARMDAEMDEVRLSYVESLGSLDLKFREEDLILRFAGGGEFAYRDMTLSARTDDGLHRQKLDIRGETLSLAARGRAEWLDFTLDLDYALSPDLVISGDYGGFNHDIELRGSYAIPLRDVTFFAGYRYSTLEADGRQGQLGYDADLQIDGFQFGMTVSL